MLDKYKRLGYNTLLIFIGSVGAKLLSLLMLPFYTRWLTVEEYGTTDIINVYTAFLISLVTCCISEALFIFPKNQSKFKQCGYFSSGVTFMFISMLVSFVLFAAAKSIFSYYGILETFSDYVWLIFIMLFSTFGQELVQQFVRSINKIKIYSFTGLVQTICIAALSFILIPRFHVDGFIWAIISANILAMLFALFFSGAYRYFYFRRINKAYCYEMLRYCLPLIPNSVMWWIVGALNRPVLESTLGLHAIGIYAVANKFPSMLAVVYTIFIQSWQISVLEEFNSEGYTKFYNKVFKNIFFILLLVSIIVAICSQFLVYVFAAESFSDSWRYIPILTFAVLFTNISGFVGSNFVATRESKYFLYTSIVGTFVSLILNLILIPMWGLMGAAVTVLLSHFSIALMRFYYSWKYVKIENIWGYITMLFMNLAVILVLLNIDSVWFKSVFIGAIFIILILLNKSVISEWKTIFCRIKL